MDIVYRKSDGKIFSIFSTHGVKQNVSSEMDYIAIDLPGNVKPGDLERLYYLNVATKKFKKKPVLDIMIDEVKIVIQKKNQGGKKLNGDETIRLKICREAEKHELNEVSKYDLSVVNQDVQLTNGKYEFSLTQITNCKVRQKVVDIHIFHPLCICKAMRKKAYKKGVKTKTWQLLQ